MYRLHVKHSCDMECGSPAIMATLPCQNNFCSLQGLVSMRLQLIWLVVLSSIYCQLLWHIQRSVKEEGYVMLQNLRYEDRQETVKWAEQSQGQIPARKPRSKFFVLEGLNSQYTYLQGIRVSWFPQHWHYINNPAHFESQHFHMSGHFYTDMCN